METHYLRHLDVEVVTPDLDTALALRARLEDLAWTLIPRVLERVFDAFMPPDSHFRLDRLDLDLGTLRSDRLEEDALAALERSLSEALAEALGAARDGPSISPLIPPAQARLDQFGRWLVDGVVSFRSAGEAFNPAADLHALIAETPTEVLDLLRRHARDRRVLERLVLHMDEDALRAVLALLAPADATLILAYLADILLLHQTGRTMPLAGPVLRRVLWVVSLDYLLHDAGSQFNRRSFMGSLLTGVAEQEGIAYDALLDLLWAALARTEQRTALGSSLPSVLRELLSDRAPTGTPPPPDQDGRAALEIVLAQAEAGDAGPLLMLLRRHAIDLSELQRAVGRLTAQGFHHLLRALQPQHAAEIAGDLDTLSAAHRQEPLLARSETAFTKVMWLRVLQSMLGSVPFAFDRRSWLQGLLSDLAALDDMPSGRFLARLAGSLGKVPRSLAQGLGAEVAAFAKDLSTGSNPAGTARDTVAPVTAQSVRDGGSPSSAEGMQPAVPADATAAPAGGGQAGMPDDGLLPLAVQVALDSGDVGGLADMLRAADGPGRRVLLRPLAHDPALLIRLIGTLPDAMRYDLVAALDPVNADVIAAMLRMLWSLHADEPLVPSDSAALQRLTWALAVQAATQTSSGPFDRAALLGRVLRGIGRYEGVAPEALAGSLYQRLDGTHDGQAWARAALRDLSQPNGDPMPLSLGLVVRFLRSGQPPAGARALPELARRDPAGLAALFRRVARDLPNGAEALIARLLDWLHPEEIVNTLVPGQTEAAVRWAEWLTDASGCNDRVAWGQVLETALLGGPFPVPATAGPGQRLDRMALLRHWLEQGSLPWWAPAGTDPVALLVSVTQGSAAELRALFEADDSMQIRARLQQAVVQCGPTHGTALLERLAPWIFGMNGPLADVAAGWDASGGSAQHLPALVAALSKTPLDRSAPAGPPPVQANATPVPALEDPVSADRAVLFAWLSGPRMDAAMANPRMIRRLAALADAGDPELDVTLRTGLARNGARWVAALPDEVLSRLLYRIIPGQARFLLDAMQLLQQASRDTPRQAGRAAWWTSLLALLTEAGTRGIRDLLTAWVRSVTGNDTAAISRLLSRARQLARNGEQASLFAVVRAPPAVTPGTILRRGDGKAAPPNSPGPIYLDNAGLVLFGPFLPRFFEQLGLLTVEEDGVARIVGTESASRGVHLLQYLVDEQCDRAEPDLVLNKLLCGLSPADPVAPSIVPSEQDIAVCNAVVRAVIANWGRIGGTSPAGLRETFLQRPGRLLRDDDRWTLQVQRKTVDVLMDQIPWSLALVYHRWMHAPVHVTW